MEERLSGKIIIIIQARTGSTRFPNKILKKIGKKTLIDNIIIRLKKVNKVDNIVLATTKNNKDKILKKVAKKHSINFFSGSVNDLVDRFYNVSRLFNAKYILRHPADNPYPDPEEINKLINYHIKSKKDFSSNICNFMNNNYPDGIGIEIFNFEALKKIYFKQKSKRFREHLALNFYDYLRKKKNKQFNFKIGTINCTRKKSCPDLILDINFKKDLEFIKRISSYYRSKKFIRSEDIVSWYKNVHLRNN